MLCQLCRQWRSLQLPPYIQEISIWNTDLTCDYLFGMFNDIVGPFRTFLVWGRSRCTGSTGTWYIWYRVITILELKYSCSFFFLIFWVKSSHFILFCSIIFLFLAFLWLYLATFAKRNTIYDRLLWRHIHWIPKINKSREVWHNLFHLLCVVPRVKLIILMAEAKAKWSSC